VTYFTATTSGQAAHASEQTFTVHAHGIEFAGPTLVGHIGASQLRADSTAGGVASNHNTAIMCCRGKVVLAVQTVPMW
jgi:hypothetical protein